MPRALSPIAATTGGSGSATTTTASDSGNVLSGAYGISQTVVTRSTGTRSGGDSGTTYAQASSDSTSLTTQDSGNSWAGDETTATNGSTSSRVSESGTYLSSSTPYSLSQTVTSNTAKLQALNAFSGSDSQPSTASGSTTLTATGSNGAGSYILGKQIGQGSTWQQQGNDLSGGYSGSGSDNSTVTIQESSSYAAGAASYTEVSVVGAAVQESGNVLSGAYSRTTSGSSTVTLQDSGTNAGGSFAVGQSDGGTSTRQESGNRLSGSYAATGTTSDSYSMGETVGASSGFSLGLGGSITPSGSGFSLRETGVNGASYAESGNSLTSAYSKTVGGSDGYSLSESGSNTGGNFSEGVQGSETASWTETGNSAQQTFSRSESGSGTYARQYSVPGASVVNSSGSYGYALQESGNWHAGSVNQSETGTDRFGLLQAFDNVASSSNGVPGHLDFSPFGATFTDPPINSTTPSGPASVIASWEMVRAKILRDIAEASSQARKDELAQDLAVVNRRIARERGKARLRELEMESPLLGGVPLRGPEPSLQGGPERTAPFVSDVEGAFRQVGQVIDHALEPVRMGGTWSGP